MVLRFASEYTRLRYDCVRTWGLSWDSHPLSPHHTERPDSGPRDRRTSKPCCRLALPDLLCPADLPRVCQEGLLGTRLALVNRRILP